MKNFYRILELPSFSTPEEIKKAYRRLSKKYHPDLHRGDLFYEEKFKDIQEAYSVLKSPLKKRNFDEKLEAFYKSQILKKEVRQKPKPAQPPLKKPEIGRKTKAKSIRKKDIYIGASIMVFFIAVIAVITFLEKTYYHNQSSLEFSESTYEIPLSDTMHLIEGYKTDSLVSKFYKIGASKK